jgi:phosphotransferase system HPr (HPr) family protein
VTLTLLSPMKGWIAPLQEVPDPVFAERMLGDGVAIDPTGSTLHAPCDAEVVSLAPTAHAVTLRADNGAEILIHIGLETVALDGAGFAAHIRAGQRVKAGEALITFDLDLLARRAKSLMTPILLINSDAFSIAWKAQDCTAEVGDRLMTIQSMAAYGEAEATAGAEHHRTLVLGLPHGLHARPAGRVAALMKPFAAQASILARGRAANAKSPISLMTLGAAHGDELKLLCRGADAEAALNTLAAFLISDGGEMAAPPAPAPPSVVSSSPLAVKVDGVLKGVPAAPGHAIGHAIQFRRTEIRVVEQGNGVAEERSALSAAVDAVRKQIESSASGSTGAEIMAAHLALLDDSELHTAANETIVEGKSAASAWAKALDEHAAALQRLDDPYLKGRANDLIDLKRQVLLALGGQVEPLADLPGDAILLADDLLPSELMALSGRILGLCTAAGGATSHVAIIARTRGGGRCCSGYRGRNALDPGRERRNVMYRSKPG